MKVDKTVVLADLGKFIALAVWIPSAFYAAPTPLVLAVLAAALLAQLVAQRSHGRLQEGYDRHMREERALQDADAAAAARKAGKGKKGRVAPRTAAAALGMEPDISRVVCHFFDGPTAPLRRGAYLGLKAACRYCMQVQSLAQLAKVAVLLAPDARLFLADGIAHFGGGGFGELEAAVRTVPLGDDALLAGILALAVAVVVTQRRGFYTNATALRLMRAMRLTFPFAVAALLAVLLRVTHLGGAPASPAHAKAYGGHAALASAVRPLLIAMPGWVLTHKVLMVHGPRQGTALMGYLTAATAAAMLLLSAAARAALGHRHASPLALSFVGSNAWGLPVEAALLVGLSLYLTAAASLSVLLDPEADGNAADIVAGVLALSAQRGAAVDRATRAAQRNAVGIALSLLTVAFVAAPSAEFGLALATSNALLNVAAILTAAAARRPRQAPAARARKGAAAAPSGAAALLAMSLPEAAAAVFYTAAALYIQCVYRMQ
jgi:hypothetical protein